MLYLCFKCNHGNLKIKQKYLKSGLCNFFVESLKTCVDDSKHKPTTLSDHHTHTRTHARARARMHTVQFKMVFMHTEKPSFPNVAFGTVPMFV